MGAFGHLQCTANCGHPMAFLHAGAGMAAVRAVKRCTECGQVMDVLAARVEHGGVVDASGRGRCPDCRSQRLRPAPEVEALIDVEPSALARCRGATHRSRGSPPASGPDAAGWDPALPATDGALTMS